MNTVLVCDQCTVGTGRRRQPSDACLEPQAMPVHGCLSTPLLGKRACSVSHFPTTLLSPPFRTCQHDQLVSKYLLSSCLLCASITLRIKSLHLTTGPYGIWTQAPLILPTLISPGWLQPFPSSGHVHMPFQLPFLCLAGSSSALSSSLIDVTSSKRLSPTTSGKHGRSFPSFVYIQLPVCLLFVCRLFIICHPH